MPIGQYNMSAPTRDCYSEMICILRKIHRLRKHPWISAQTMDPQIVQADLWIAQIHRLRPTATLSLTHWDSTPRPPGRQSRALTTELERATCGKLRCRGPFSSSFVSVPISHFPCRLRLCSGSLSSTHDRAMA